MGVVLDDVDVSGTGVSLAQSRKGAKSLEKLAAVRLCASS
jgi:hypothetical protein